MSRHLQVQGAVKLVVYLLELFRLEIVKAESSNDASCGIEVAEIPPDLDMLETDGLECAHKGEKFAYTDKNTLLDFLLSHMPNPENMPEAERRKFFDSHLSQLKHWKQQA